MSEKKNEELVGINGQNIAIIVGVSLIIGFLLLLLLGSTGGSSKSVEEETEPINNISEEETIVAQGQDVEELKIEIVKEGTGEVTKVGDTISVDYTGTLLDGSQFDSSVDRGPFEFTLGEGRVIQGWDEGLVGIKVGTKLIITIPSEQGYGVYGSPPTIPGGSALVFDIEIHEIK